MVLASVHLAAPGRGDGFDLKGRNEILNVLSLFDGMSCGRIALERAGIKVDNYFSAEIDKYAIKVADKNWPQDADKRLGDVCKIKAEDLPKIDLLIGGSPCQSFSRAGDGSGFDGKSKLFWEWVRLLKECSPKYFLLENVVMKKEWESIITDALGVEPILLNSSNYSAQNRERLFWTNIPTYVLNKSGAVLGDVTEAKIIPENIEDLLLTGEIPTRQKFFEGSSTLKRMLKNLAHPDQKSKCLTASMFKGMAANGMTNIYTGTEVRQLLPIECERLQTVPENYTECASNTQRYKMLGNGWTVDVIAHIFKGLKAGQDEPQAK